MNGFGVKVGGLRVLFFIGLVLWALALVYLGYGVRQTEFYSILIGYTVAFLGYALMLHTHILGIASRWVWWAGIGLRILLLGALPALSDDFYRFLWDGFVARHGYNALAHLPSELIAQFSDSSYAQVLYSEMNSPDYYTVYPPVLQGLFYLASLPENVVLGVWILKAFYLMAEMATGYGLYLLLRRFRLPHWYAMLYWLNPLVIVELMGNLHPEAVMLSFFCWAMVAFAYRKYYKAAVLYALSVLSKLLPLMFVLVIWRVLPRRYRWPFVVWMTVVLLLGALPWLDASYVRHFFESLGLYLHTFEFNAGLYYLFRYAWEGMAEVHPKVIWAPLALGVVSLSVVVLSLCTPMKRAWRDVPIVMLAIYIVFALMSFSLHPWYLVLPVFLTALYPNMSVPTWSYMITWSYCTYRHSPYEECLTWVGVEYLLLVLMIVLDFRFNPKLRAFFGSVKCRGGV